jgi:hypothetical protein
MVYIYNLPRNERNREMLCKIFWWIQVIDCFPVNVTWTHMNCTGMWAEYKAAISDELAAEAPCSMPGKTYGITSGGHHYGETWTSLFLSFPLITSGVKLFIDKSRLACCLYCTKSGWRRIGLFPPAKISTIPQPGNGKQGPIPEEMSLTLPTNKSKESWTKYTR